MKQEGLFDAVTQGDIGVISQLLFDAATKGDTSVLSQLLQRDQNIFDRDYLNSESQNVLHVSAMLGHAAFVNAVLQANFSYRMCLARDRNGKNPLHLAVIHAKSTILNMVKHLDGLMQAALHKVDRNGTILHLCVEYNQLDAMKSLLKIFQNSNFVGAKNEDGMTILHQALECNQNQRRQDMIIYLIENAADIINITNADNKTALDLFLEQAGMPPVYFRLFEKYRSLLLKLEGDHGAIKESFHRSKARSGAGLGKQWLKSVEKSRGALMIVASVIATLAFQATTNPPGGFWQEDTSEHRAGQSVLADTHVVLYHVLCQCNTLAFTCSLGAIMMHVACGFGTSLPLKVQLYALFGLIIASIISLSASYGLSIGATAPKLLKPSRNSLMRGSPVVLQHIVLIGVIVEFILLQCLLPLPQFTDYLLRLKVLEMLREEQSPPVNPSDENSFIGRFKRGLRSLRSILLRSIP